MSELTPGAIIVGDGGTGYISVPGMGSASEQLGFGAQARGNNTTVFGNTATAGEGINTVAIGKGAIATQSSGITVVDYTLGALDTITLTQPGAVVTVLTENSDFTAITDEDTTAENIRVAINAISGLTATRVNAVVTVVGDLTALATGDATAWTVSLGFDPDNSVVIGNNALLNYNWSVVIGGDATTVGNDNVTIGPGATGAEENVTIGRVAVGGFRGVTVGSGASSGSSSVAVGQNSSAAGVGSLALGVNATADSNSGVAVGPNATATGNGTALGTQASGANRSVALGAFATCSSEWGVALGWNASTTAGKAIAIGRDATATAKQFVVGATGQELTDAYFGRGVETTDTSLGTFSISSTSQVTGTNTDEPGTSLSIRSGKGTGAGTPTTIDFQTPTAGVTSTTQQSLATRIVIQEGNVEFFEPITINDPTTISGDLTLSADLLFSPDDTHDIGSADGTEPGVNRPRKVFVGTELLVGDASVSITANTITVGAAGAGTITVPGAGTSSEQFGISATASGDNSIAFGANANATAARTTAIGDGSTASAINTIAIGEGATASISDGNIAIGRNSTSSGGGSGGIAIGGGVTALNDSVAIGGSVTSTESVVVGKGATAAGSAVAIGRLANAGSSGVAIGQGTTTATFASVVIGRGAAATTSNQIVIGSSTYTYNDLYFGAGVTHTATPTAVTINATSINTTVDTAGGSIELNSGTGTGAGAASTISFKTPTVLGGPSATQQTLATRMTLSEAGANVVSTDGLGYISLSHNGLNIGTITTGGTWPGRITIPGSGASSVAIGIASNASTDSSIAIGNSATALGGASAIAIGKSASVTANVTSTGCLAIAGAVDGNLSLAIGTASSAGLNGSDSQQCVAIGGGAQAGTGGAGSDECTAVGYSSGAGSTAISLNRCIAMGQNAQAQARDALALGALASVTGERGIGIGVAANVAHFSSLAIGRSATSTGVNQVVFGSNQWAFSKFYLGQGVSVAGAIIDVEIHATKKDVGETDESGGNLLIASGEGTGAGAVSTITFQTPDVLGTGTTQQSLVDRLVLSETGVSGATTNGQSWNIQFAVTELTGLSGATATASNLIPAGSMVIGITTRVTTLITGATSFDTGDGVDPDRWGATIAVGAGTTSDPTDFTDNSLAWQTSAAGDVVLTANGGSFSAGAVRVSVAYISLVAPTS